MKASLSQLSLISIYFLEGKRPKEEKSRRKLKKLYSLGFETLYSETCYQDEYVHDFL